jgi:hypothetical protein
MLSYWKIESLMGANIMQSLDPQWLSIELEAIQHDDGDWNRILGESYDIAVQKVFEYQARMSSDSSGKEAS